jgi:hypothetical protein
MDIFTLNGIGLTHAYKWFPTGGHGYTYYDCINLNSQNNLSTSNLIVSSFSFFSSDSSW